MMMAICSKFGTRGIGVAVGVGEGVRVAVGGTGVNVADGTGVGVTVGAGVCVHAANKIKRRTKKRGRFIRPPYKSALRRFL